MLNIIFSDVDGCIIGQGVTAFNQINEAINRLSSSFLLILTTGKTAHEIIQLNHSLKLRGPFIIENGHGILFKNPLSSTEYTLLPLGEIKPNKLILNTIAPSHSLLTEMDDDYLASLTGISVEDVYLAKQRYFTEPIFIKHLSESDLKKLKKQLIHRKLYYIQTSRFLHVTTQCLNKGRAIQYLLKVFFSKQEKTTYAIGDSLNDFSMFARCDHNYYIENQQINNIPKQCNIIIEKELTGWLRSLSKIVSHALRDTKR